MIEESVADFLKQGIEHVYPNQWSDFAPGFGACIETYGGIGIDVVYDERIKFASGVLSDLSLSPNLVREVAMLTETASFGHFSISEGAPGNWIVVFAYKVSPSWIAPNTPRSVQHVVDVLSNIPEMVTTRRQHLQERFGGTPWTLDEGWWLVLMSHF